MAEPILITAPAVEPISLSEAKAHCRVDHSDEDDWFTVFAIPAARQQCEHETGRRLITQTWDMVLDAFPPDGESIQLHGSLVGAQSITSVSYLDTAGAVQTFSSSNYTLDAQNLPGYVFPNDGVAWPSDVADSANAVKVRVVVGFGDAGTDVPAPLRQWMLMQIGAMYRSREAFSAGVPVAELPNRYVDRMLDGYRYFAL